MTSNFSYSENKPHSRHDEDRKAAPDDNKVKFNPKELLNVRHACID